MDYKERLKQYLEEDAIYSEYKSGKCDMSDFDKFCVEHCKDIECLLNENQELKEQLEVGEQQYNDLVEEKEKIQEQLSSNTLQFENQQKEFIEWLEDYIDTLKTESDSVEGLGICEYYTLLALEEVLSKYKETIGVKDEKVNC